MVWPYLMALSVICVIVTAIAKDRAMLGLALLILCGYIGARGIKVFLVPDLHLIGFALLWSGVATIDAIQRQVDARTVLLSAVALCYLWAKLAASEWIVGSMPFVISDILAVLVMLSILAGAGRAFVDGMADMGYHLGRGAADKSSGAAMQTQKKAA